MRSFHASKEALPATGAGAREPGPPPRPDTKLGLVGRPLAYRVPNPVVVRGFLVAGDIFGFLLCAWLAQLIRYLLWGPMPHSLTLWSAGACWVGMRLYEGLYPGYGIAAPEDLRRASLTTLVTGLGHAAVLFAIKGGDESRFLAVGTWALLLVVNWPLRAWVKSSLVRLRLYSCPVVIAGAGKTGALAIKEMHANPELGFVPVAAFDDDPAKHGTLLDGVPVLGPLSSALPAKFPYPVRHAVLAIPGADGQVVVQTARLFARRFPNLALVPNLVGLANLWVTPRPVGAFLTLEVKNTLLDSTSRRAKRALDLCLGLPLFLMALPVILVAALAVRLASRGPAFFSQEREGFNGTPIRVWKIRTMVQDAEEKLAALLARDPTARSEWERSMKLADDPRLVPIVGRLLRRFSLDELPQLWNVIRGDMSLVGPRPFPEYHLRNFSPEFRELRREVPAGLTGLWQVTERSEGDLAIQEAADSYYIRNWSLWLDLWILTRTVSAVLFPKGAY
jgi:Undecaprenyl-phosphate galactose phosphotransferase WbaP